MKFNTSNFMNNAPLYDDQTNEILGYGYIEDNISMSFIGPTLYERVKILSDKILIVSNVTLGRIHHHNEARIDYVSVLIKGNTFGISGLLGLDYLLNDNFSIGVDISTLTGKFSQYEINGQKMDLAEDDNVNRWNFNIGLRMFN